MTTLKTITIILIELWTQLASIFRRILNDILLLVIHSGCALRQLLDCRFIPFLSRNYLQVHSVSVFGASEKAYPEVLLANSRPSGQ